VSSGFIDTRPCLTTKFPWSFSASTSVIIVHPLGLSELYSEVLGRTDLVLELLQASKFNTRHYSIIIRSSAYQHVII